MPNIQNGCVDIWVDEVVPCLKDIETGALKETFVFRVESKSCIKTFTEKNGWGVDWETMPQNVEIYALVLKDDNQIQGLVGIRRDDVMKAAYLHWACAAPWNNKHAFGTQKYSGVGGHLFAIAVDKSKQWGFEGVVYGFALNNELLKHYIEVLGCSYLGRLHPYQFMLGIPAAQKLLEVYTYEWN